MDGQTARIHSGAKQTVNGTSGMCTCMLVFAAARSVGRSSQGRTISLNIPGRNIRVVTKCWARRFETLDVKSYLVCEAEAIRETLEKKIGMVNPSDPIQAFTSSPSGA